MSPAVPAGGLRSEHAESWSKVWSVADYEQDEFAARMYNGGAMASFEGYLYWGTTHAPMSAGLAHAQVYGLFDPAEPENSDVLGLIKALLGSHRPVSIFRGRSFGTPEEETQVLYGLAKMPAYLENPLPFGPERVWQMIGDAK